jgi:SecD/SecF fusion protein
MLQCAQHFAVVVDGELLAAPYIDYARNPDGIPGDNGMLLDMSPAGLAAARGLGVVLQTGALPVRLVPL